MKFYTKQKNINTNVVKKNRGFTLIETLIAVFILTIALNGLFALIASSLFSARYARNEITANYLAQEIIDYIRNDRDTYAFQMMADPNGGWANFLNHYRATVGSNCFVGFDSLGGCEIDVTDIDSGTGLATVTSCVTPASSTFGSTNCKLLNYDESASNKSFYTYQNGVPSNFKRQVILYQDASSPAGLDQLIIKVTIEWRNGNIDRSRTLQTALLNWQN